MPIPQTVGDRHEIWTLGYLIDTILTRDPWMHRIDISRAHVRAIPDAAWTARQKMSTITNAPPRGRWLRRTALN